MVHMISLILLVVGGINWLLVAFDFNLVSWIFGSMPAVEMIIYILVGLAAIYEVVTHKKNCKKCDSGAMPAAPTGM